MWPLVAGASRATTDNSWQRDHFSFQIIRRIHEQVNQAEQDCKGTTIEGLMGPPIRAARDLVSLHVIAQAWQSSLLAYLNDSTMLAWDFAGKTLPTTETRLADDDFIAVHQAVDELEEAAQADGLPADLRALIQAQVAALREVLKFYAVQGVQPLKDQLAVIAGTVHRK